MINILTIDLEDYYQVSAFDSVVKREDWDKYESRIERNTYRLLEMLNEPLATRHSPLCTPVQATFFCLGWIAERYPDLIREIQRQGHEIACHSYDHRLVYHMTPNEFREDIRKSRQILEDTVGEDVVGYRASSYSITKKSKWALEILMEEGFRYDSSIFPIHHDVYGFPKAPRFPFVIFSNGNSDIEFKSLDLKLHTTSNSELVTPHHLNTAGPQNCSTAAQQHFTTSINSINPTNPSNPSNPYSVVESKDLASNLKRSAPPSSSRLIEFPISTLRIWGQNVPISGGGYFRLFPYSLIKKGLKRINKGEGKPFIFYLHPWELDRDQPKVNNASFKSKFRHYINLDKTESKLKKLLKDFSFTSLRDILELNKLNGPNKLDKPNKPIGPK